MPTPDLHHARWFVSSHSSDNGTCVEVAALPGRVATRDSTNPHAGHLLVTRHAFRAFARAAADHRLH